MWMVTKVDKINKHFKTIIFIIVIFIISAIVIILIYPNNAEPIITGKANIQKLLDEGLTGDNIKVAIIDTGVTQDLLDYYASEQFNYYNVVDESDNVLDTHSHGSWVVCLMYCVSNNSEDKGLIPNAEFIIIKAYDNYGFIKPEYISSAIDYARENNADLINLSMGTLTDYSDIENAINTAIENGIIIIAAYGDEDKALFPARYSNVLSVITLSDGNATDADFLVDRNVFELNIINNEFHNYREDTNSSFSSAVITSFLALLMEKCEKAGIEFNINKIEGMIK